MNINIYVHICILMYMYMNKCIYIQTFINYACLPEFFHFQAEVGAFVSANPPVFW